MYRNIHQNRRIKLRRIKNLDSSHTQNRRLVDRRHQPLNESDRRASSRIIVEIPIGINFSQDEKFHAKTSNISANGLNFSIDEKLPLNTELDLCLFLPDIYVPIQTVAIIRWRRPGESLRSYHYGVILKGLEEEYMLAYQQYYIHQNKIGTSRKSIKKHLDNIIYHSILRNLLRFSFLGNNSLNSNSDSGLNFDHIYKNRPKGRSILGKWIDSMLLHLPAARATRFRKKKLIEALRNEIIKNKIAGQKTKIVDLASGPARYICEAITPELQADVEVLCIDKDPSALEFGKHLAEGKNIRFIKANVFNLQQISRLGKKLDWKPNIILASGLIYYYDDHTIKVLFRQILDALTPGGLFLFSNMVSNPNAKLIGKICTTKNGQPWIPIGRHPTIITKWLSELGFTETRLFLDRWKMYGIFTSRRQLVSGNYGVEKSEFLLREFPEFRINGITFKGEVFLPANNSPLKGIIVFVHGLGYCLKSYSLNPTIFTDAGYIYFGFNSRGHGGTLGEWTLPSAIDDLQEIIGKVKFRYQTNNSVPLTVFAHSTGALISAMASKKETLIDFASFVSPVTSILNSYLYWHQTGYNQAAKPLWRLNGIVPRMAAAILDNTEILLAYKNGKSIGDLNVPYRYGMLKGKVLKNFVDAIAHSPDLLNKENNLPRHPTIVFSSAIDEITPISSVLEFYERAQASNKKFIRTSAANHFQEDSWASIQSETVLFLNNTRLSENKKVFSK